MALSILTPPLLFGLALLSLGTALAQDAATELVDEVPTVSVLTPPKPAYRDLEEIHDLLAEWARADPVGGEIAIEAHTAPAIFIEEAIAIVIATFAK